MVSWVARTGFRNHPQYEALNGLIPVNTHKQWFQPWFLGWRELDFATIHSMEPFQPMVIPRIAKLLINPSVSTALGAR